MNKRNLFLITLLAPLLYLGLTHPYFEAYLNIPNRHLLSWDPAIHAKDGLVFLLQLKRLDILSFIYTFINLSFWMPLHPLMIGLTSVFFPFGYDAYVYLNFVSLAAGLGWFTFLTFRSTLLNAFQKTMIVLGTFYFLLRIGNSAAFWATHLNIMIESMAMGLTLVFVLSSLLEDFEADRKFYVRTSIIALSLLFFTKVQYGLFYGAAYFAKHLYIERAVLFGAGNLFHRVMEELRKKKIFVAVLALFTLAGLAILFTNRADGLWAISFAVLLMVTWVVGSKKMTMVEIRHSSPYFLQAFTRWMIIPFGWFYLLPFRQKIRFLLYNAQTQTNESLSQKLTVMFSDLSAFLNSSLSGAFVLVGFCIVTSIVFVARNPKQRLNVIYAWALCLSFYIPMSLFAGARMVRLSATWVVLFPVFILVWLAYGMKSRVLSAALCILLLMGCVYERTQFQTTAATQYEQNQGFLAEDHQSIAMAIKEFDFTKPGVVYGLGNTLDIATILFDLEVLKVHPEYSSVFSKREDRELVANDFGKKGNQNPTETILSRAEKPDVRQIMLFQSGFKADEFKSISEALTRKHQFSPSVQNAHFVLFRRAN